jgi:hypothetical protein
MDGSMASFAYLQTAHIAVMTTATGGNVTPISCWTVRVLQDAPTRAPRAAGTYALDLSRARGLWHDNR